MTARAHILSLLHRAGREGIGEVDIWDVQQAARGLTVILNNGQCVPCICSFGTARQVLHLWAVQEQER
ncbi:MAG: hypothetical protein U1A78_32215 [Polyangia bacterium]